MTPAQIDSAFNAADADLTALIDIAMALREVLPILRPVVKDLAIGGMEKDAAAGILVFSHLSPLKDMLSNVLNAAKTIKA